MLRHYKGESRGEKKVPRCARDDNETYTARFGITENGTAEPLASLHWLEFGRWGQLIVSSSLALHGNWEFDVLG